MANQEQIESVRAILSEAASEDADSAQSESAEDRDAVQGRADPESEPEAEVLDQHEPDAEASVDDAAEDDTSADADDQPVALKDLAEQLNLEARDLYDVEVPLGNGQAATLGEIKDAFKEYGPVQEMREKVESDKDEWERSVMATRQELSAMLNVIPPELRDEVIAAGKQYNETWQKDQRDAVLEAIPDWSNPDTLAKDRDDIVRLGGQYGFSSAEMQYTQDARTLRMLRDFARLKAEREAIDIASKKKPGKPNAPGKQATRKLTKRKLNEALARAKASTDVRDKQGAIRMLLEQ